MTEPQQPEHVQPGQVLAGKFRVERVLGEGGMGVVVAVTHVALGQVQAMKFMLPHALANPESVARFEREARAAVRLKSDHVAKVTDVGRLENGAPYIVMEFLEGEDLDQLLNRVGALPVEVAVDLVLQAAEAVAEAHSIGIVHRDLKPKNLFLTTRLSGKPLVKVLDFGISKSTGPEDMSLTSTTQVMGSPNYMSPEQLRSARDVDGRSDVWALGAILYELLTGRVPFLAETVTQLTAMVIADPPTPIDILRPDLPGALAAAVMKCLEKKREDRYQSVVDFATAIAPFASPDGASQVRELLGAPSILAASQNPLSASSSGANRVLSASSSGAIRSAERPSVRVAGNAVNTEAGWDRTQLAPPQEAAPKSRLPFLLAAAALVMALGVGAFVLFKKHDGGTTSPAGQSPTANVTATIPANTGEAPLPTVRDPVNPPLVSPTGGPDHPPPSGLLTSTPTSVRTGATGTVKPPATKPDAGARTAPSAAGSGEDLPNSRN